MTEWFTPLEVIEPRRVLINCDGEALSPRRAEREHGIVSDCVFVRNDGWTLGAPASLKDVARNLWAGDWREVWTRESNGKWTRMLINSGGK